MSAHRHRAEPGITFSDNQLRAVEAAARRAAASAPEQLREDAFAQGRLHGLTAISRDPSVSRERLTQLISRHVDRWVAAQLRAPSAASLSDVADVAAADPDPALRAAIQRLPLPFAAIAWRHIIDGAPLDVIAEETGLALPFVHYLFHRAVDMLAGASEAPAYASAAAPLAGELSEETFAAEVRAELARARRRGHTVGLIILRGPGSAAAQRRAIEALLRNVRALDAVGWLDGAPAVLMPHLSAADAPGVAARLSAAATEAAVLRWSAGWAVSPADGRTLPALLAAAQALLASAGRATSADDRTAGVRATDDDHLRRAA